MAEPTPSTAARRLITLDALRGFALLCILVPNIVGLSWPAAAFTDPAVIGPGWWNRVAHDLTATVFFGKFWFLFALMFGASVVFFDRKSASAWLWHRRCLALLVIGLAHAYLFWYGDILVWYAVAGLTGLWWMRGLSARIQLWGGLALYVIAHVPMALVFMDLVVMPRSDALIELLSNNTPGEVASYLGSWTDALRHRFFQMLGSHILDAPTFLPKLWGVMLMGMGLTKLGVLGGERSTRFHARLGIVLIGLGSVLTGSLYVVVQRLAEHPGVLWPSIGSLVGVPLAIGYAQLVIVATRTKIFEAPTRVLADVGRMALSNYLLQTLVCTTIMYGYGFGRFASVEYPALFGLVAGVWIVNITFSVLWLRVFTYGPAEWLWRQVTYLGFDSKRA